MTFVSLLGQIFAYRWIDIRNSDLMGTWSRLITTRIYQRLAWGWCPTVPLCWPHSAPPSVFAWMSHVLPSIKPAGVCRNLARSYAVQTVQTNRRVCEGWRAGLPTRGGRWEKKHKASSPQLWTLGCFGTVLLFGRSEVTLLSLWVGLISNICFNFSIYLYVKASVLLVYNSHADGTFNTFGTAVHASGDTNGKYDVATECASSLWVAFSHKRHFLWLIFTKKCLCMFTL